MGRQIVKNTLALMLAAGCSPALGADRLDCMSVPMGEVEQTVLNRHESARRGDDKLLAAVQASLESRAKVCAVLNGWSSSATRLAFEHRWLQVQWGRTPIFSAEEETRLTAALQPMQSRLITLLYSSVQAVARGDEPPPPPLNDTRFTEFNVLLKEANIPQNAENERRLSGWLYTRGFQAAVLAAFKTE